MKLNLERVDQAIIPVTSLAFNNQGIDLEGREAFDQWLATQRMDYVQPALDCGDYRLVIRWLERVRKEALRHLKPIRGLESRFEFEYLRVATAVLHYPYTAEQTYWRSIYAKCGDREIPISASNWVVDEDGPRELFNAFSHPKLVPVGTTTNQALIRRAVESNGRLNKIFYNEGPKTPDWARWFLLTAVGEFTTYHSADALDVFETMLSMGIPGGRATPVEETPKLSADRGLGKRVIQRLERGFSSPVFGGYNPNALVWAAFHQATQERHRTDTSKWCHGDGITNPCDFKLLRIVDSVTY